MSELFLYQDINEHPPVFSSPTYTSSVAEDLAVGQPVGVTVMASENGDVGLGHTITYTITSGNIGGAFAVGETSGVVTVANPLDYESLSMSDNPIALTVSASLHVNAALY